MRRIGAVSVIMPAYNAMPYLREAVESVLGQSFANLELVIVDDGSTDGTPQYLASVTDARVRVIHQENRGDAAASNAALRATRYDWVARMDADDVALPQRLEREAAFLEQNPQYDLVSCGWGYIGRNGRPLKARHIAQLAAPPRFQPLTDPMIVHPGMLYRKEAVLKVGGYQDDVAGDLDLSLRLDEKGHLLASIPEVLVLVRVLPGSVSSRNYFRQLVFRRFARAASLARRRGEKEPDWEEFCREHWPRGRNWLRAEGARQFRLAGAAWAAGQHPQAAARLLWSLMFRPAYAVSKLRLYFLSSRETRAVSFPSREHEDAST